MKCFDVIIIGAGIAGSRLAWLLGELNYNVLLIERSEEIKRDTGIVSVEIENFLPLKESHIKRKVKKIRFISPSHYEFTLKSRKPFCYILKREKFGKWLRKMAEKNCNFTLEEFIKMKVSSKVEVETNDNKYRAKIVVGADGAFSKVRKIAKIESPRIFYGAIYYGNEFADEPVVWVNKNYSNSFFSWFSPPKEYGIITKYNTKRKLFNFLKNEKLVKEIENNVYIRPIPIGFTRSVSNRTILVGDACGQVKPITGGGIVFSLIAAKIAADVINNGIKDGKFSIHTLYEYEKRWKKLLSNEIRLQLVLRKFFTFITNDQVDTFFREFGEKIENINNFTYDRILSLIKQMSIIKALKYFTRLVW